MQAQYEAREFSSPDALSAVAHYVQSEYGYSGYRIGIAAASFRVSVFEVRCGDGSCFNVVADRWGNVKRIPDDATQQDAATIVSRMSSAAVAS